VYKLLTGLGDKSRLYNQQPFPPCSNLALSSSFDGESPGGPESHRVCSRGGAFICQLFNDNDKLLLLSGAECIIRRI
jgi:hypothetical protein